jgi:hypothetical protein
MGADERSNQPRNCTFRILRGWLLLGSARMAKGRGRDMPAPALQCLVGVRKHYNEVIIISANVYCVSIYVRVWSGDFRNTTKITG